MEKIDKIYAYLDSRDNESPVLIGTIQRKGEGPRENYVWTFDDAWLDERPRLMLSGDIFPTPGKQASNRLLGLFQDALPDRWGMELLKEQEMRQAIQEGRRPRVLTPFDMLIRIHDLGRMGALRFKVKPLDNTFMVQDLLPAIPPMESLRDLEYYSDDFQKNRSKRQLSSETTIRHLINTSSPLGGARPKANVYGNDGQLYIAKFPSRSDDYDVEEWEHFSHLLASHCGINAATTKTVTAKKGKILISKRFDRTPGGKRIHFASAMTLLGFKDGASAADGTGYLDIVGLILKNSKDPVADLEELYRRVAFNICIGNCDDHFRNHGFLLDGDGWRLSPAYDMNPSHEIQQGILINSETNEADLNILLRSAEDYMLEIWRGRQIIEEVQERLKDWPRIAREAGLSSTVLQTFARRFDEYAKTDLTIGGGLGY